MCTSCIIYAMGVCSLVQEFGELGSLAVRLWKGKRHVEVEWTAGPILHYGKEIVLWYKTDVPSGKMFYTDANGRELQPRRRDYSPTWPLKVTEPVAGNFYPVTSAIYIGVSPSSGCQCVTLRYVCMVGPGCRVE